MKKYLIGLFSLFSIIAFAQGATNSQSVSWVAPTQYVDGTIIPATVAITYNVYATMGTSAEVKLRTAVAGTSISISALPVGQNNCYAVTVLLNGSNESARSPSVCGLVASLASKSVTTVVVQSP